MKNWIQSQRVRIYFSNLLLSFLTFFSFSLAGEPTFIKSEYFENQYFDVNDLLGHVKVVEDKVYVQPDNIYFSSNQIYLSVKADLIPIQYLFCDGNGIFIPIQDIQTGRGRRDIWKCPKCDYENYDGINNCGQCGRDRYARDGY